MTAEQTEAIITAVRAHPKIVKGSCSWIDETMTDGEVINFLDGLAAYRWTPKKAVLALVRYDRLLAEIEEDIQGA